MKNRPSKITWANITCSTRRCRKRYKDFECKELPLFILGPWHTEVWARGCFSLPLIQYFDSNNKPTRFKKELKPIVMKRLAIKAWNKLVADGLIKRIGSGFSSEYMYSIALNHELEIVYWDHVNDELVVSKEPIPL